MAMSSSSPEDAQHDFNAFVGAQTGLFKGVHITEKTTLCKNFHTLQKLNREEEITCMEWNCEDPSRSEREVLVGLRNQRVRLFDTEFKSFAQNVDVSDDDTQNTGPLRGVAKVGGTLVTASQSGVVKVWRTRDDERVSFNPIDEEVCKMGRMKQKDGFASEEDRLKHLATLKAGRELCKMRACPGTGGLVVTGGKENDVQLWDLERVDAGPVFRAKNVKPDFLELRVPVWVTDVCFPDASEPRLVASTNRHGHVRLYDVRQNTEQRRPSAECFFPEQAPTAMSPTPNEHRILVGTATGQVGLFDFRRAGQGNKGLFHKYKGCVGSVRAIDCLRGDRGYFACVGLDRFLRVFDLDDKKPVQKMYLKSRLNCVLLRKNFDPRREDDDEENKKAAVAKLENIEDDDDDISVVHDDNQDEWSRLPVVGQSKRKSQVRMTEEENGDEVDAATAPQKQKKK